MNRIDLAQAIATGAHSGQVRPYTGEPYIAHPARVVGILQQYEPDAPPRLIMAAWLHDVIEDCGITHDSLADSFGGEVAALVWELSKPQEPQTMSGMLIKACDLLDNVGTIGDVAPAAEAQAYLAKKAPQVQRICSRLQQPYPALAETLAQAWWRNWKIVG